MTCPAPGADAPLVSSLADYLECHASALGQNGFESAANGFFMTAMLTGCLTIYVALIGYRLILGQRYSVREAVLACLRVGLIITFCTRWPSYETVFYRTVVEGPQEIAGQMLQASGLPLLSPTDMAARLQQDYEAIQAAAITHPAPPPPPSNSPQGPGVALPQTSTAPQPPVPVVAATATRGFSVAGLVFLISTVGSLMAVRLAAALLMAIGPLVLLLALFDSLVGLLENWVAALAGLMLATAGITIVTELELGFVEGSLSQFNASGGAALSDDGLLLTSALFSLCLIGVVAAAGLVGRRLRFRGFWRHSYGGEAQPVRSDGASAISATIKRYGVALSPPSRAAVVANAVRQEGQRERMRLGIAAPTLSGPSATIATSRNEPTDTVRPVSGGLGSSLRRPTSPSRSISYARRGQRQ